MGKVWKNISVMSELTVHLFVFEFLTIYSSEIMYEDALFMKALAKANLWLSALIMLVTKLKWLWVEATSKHKINWKLIIYIVYW